MIACAEHAVKRVACAEHAVKRVACAEHAVKRVACAEHAAKRLATCWACACLLFAALPVRAADRVQVAYAATDREADEVALTLRSALDLPALQVDLRRVSSVDPRALLVAVPETTRPLARIWVDLNRDGRAFVYVVDRSWTRTYVRSLPRTADNFALDCAQVGEIVHSAVQALQEGAVIGLAIERPPRVVDEAAPSPDAAVRPPRSASHGQLGGGASYSIGPRASGELAQGPGLYGYLLAPLGAVRLGGLLALAYQPHRVTGQGAQARLDTFALRAGPLLEFAHDNRLAPRVMLAAGADIVRLEPTASAADVEPVSARTLAYPMLSLMAGLRAHLTHDVELLVALALDVDLVDTRYVRDLRDGTRVIEDPFRVRPSLLLCLGFF